MKGSLFSLGPPFDATSCTRSGEYVGVQLPLLGTALDCTHSPMELPETQQTKVFKLPLNLWPDFLVRCFVALYTHTVLGIQCAELGPAVVLPR